MTSRQRVLTALDHREPDRVPIDLGGTIMSGIMAQALHQLRLHLRLPDRPVKVHEAFQMLGQVELDVVDRLGIDVLPVESGIDILNPIQCSADGMDPQWLKDTFGKDIVFWGGSVDTQRTLPFGTPAEVAAEVAERIRILAPGGGHVFNPIHNVQFGTPPENVVAAIDTARRVGTYPIQSVG